MRGGGEGEGEGLDEGAYREQRGEQSKVRWGYNNCQREVLEREMVREVKERNDVALCWEGDEKDVWWLPWPGHGWLALMWLLLSGNCSPSLYIYIILS